MNRRATALTAMILGLTLPIAAQAAPAPNVADASALKTMLDCRKLPTKDARADCYDAAIDALNTAQAEGKVVVVDQEKVRAVRRQAFGFNLPSLSGLAKGLKEEPVAAMTYKVAAAREEADGHWLIETVEEPVWRQTQSTGYPLTPHAGSTLKIRPGMLGAFFCQVDNQVEFRCRRER